MENITITNSKGEKMNYHVLFTFDSKEFKKSYVVYTDFSKDENSDINVYYSSYKDGNLSKLEKVESKEEIELIDKLLEEYERKIKS